MRIKQMQDVLVLVDELPAAYQEMCARALSEYVADWEARNAEPPMTDREWWALRNGRSRANVERRLNRLRRSEE